MTTDPFSEFLEKNGIKTVDVTPKIMTTKELVENFYTTFSGNKFEASFCKLKEVDSKVAPYFMEDWIEEKFKELEASIRKEVAQQEKEKWIKIFDYHSDLSNEKNTYARNSARVEIEYWDKIIKE